MQRQDSARQLRDPRLTPVDVGVRVTSVSDYVQIFIFKSAQYVEILRQGRKQTSRIPGVTS